MSGESGFLVCLEHLAQNKGNLKQNATLLIVV